MRIKGPIITLVGGLVVAGVLFGLSLAATKTDSNPSTANAAANTQAKPSTPAPSAAPSQSAKGEVPAAAATPLTFAGRVNGGAATIAIAIRDGKAIAYLCNGRNLEAWLQGDAATGKLNLTGANGAALTGTYTETSAEGSVTAAGRTYTFKVKMVQPPDGLYRLAAPLAGKATISGWIRDGDEQTGMTTPQGGEGGAAPRIDPATGQVVIDGKTYQPGKVDGTTSLN